MEGRGMLEMDEHGDVLELARFIFDEKARPGRVQLETDNLGDLAKQFVFFCELYFTGAKLYNDLPIEQQLKSLEGFRQDTAEFLADRMKEALNVLPTLRHVDHGVADSVVQFQFGINYERLEQNYLNDLICNIELRMRYVYS